MNLNVLVRYAALLIGTGAPSVADPEFRVTISVVNDAGDPVAGAVVQLTYEQKQDQRLSERFFTMESVSDESGVVTMQGELPDGEFAYGALAEGHYPVRGRIHRFSDTSRRGWVPWNPTLHVTLKRILNPVPMYAKRFRAEVPKNGEPLGYDLIVGDWVAPRGHGARADLLLRLQGERTDLQNHEIEFTWSFPGAGNGFLPIVIQDRTASPLLMPHEAPVDGYTSARTWRKVAKYDHVAKRPLFKLDDVDPDEHFFIRVRSEVDADGRVTRAMYGKVHGPIEFGILLDGTGFVRMTYFLNPDGSRNVEFDPKRNLLKPTRRRDPDYQNIGP